MHAWHRRYSRHARIAAVSVIFLAACTDLPSEPARTAARTPVAARGPSPGVGGKSSLDLIEADYAAGAIDKPHVNIYREQAISAPEKLPAKYRSSAKSKGATASLARMAQDWSSLSTATQEQILDLRASGLGNLSQSVETPHFVLHYTTTGQHTVPLQDNDENDVPDFIDVAAQSLEQVWQREIGQLGYPPPIGTPAQKFHIYYKSLETIYGAAYPTNVVLESSTPVARGTATAYIVIENDFYGFPPNDEDVTGLEVIRSGALKVTQAHEFMHAIQFAINVYQSGWLMESHATWAEDAVYDGLNDWHWYLPFFLATPDLPLFSRDPYGGALFQHWLSESFGTDITRRIWMAAKTQTFADAVKNTALGGSWEPIKNFAPAEYTLGFSDFTKDAASVVPDPTNYIRATHTTYPVSVAIDPSTNKVNNRAPYGLGANFIEFIPASAGALRLVVDGTDGYAWRAFAVATPKNGGATTTFPIALDTGSAGSISITGFGTRWSKVALVVTIAGTDGVALPYSYRATIE